MNLLCSEQVISNDCDTRLVSSHMENRLNTPLPDPIFLNDRCLSNLLKAEEKYSSDHVSYFSGQKDITPEMRKIVAEWMMEVNFICTTGCASVNVCIYGSM